MTQNVTPRKPATIGERIRQARNDAGFSTTKLAMTLGVDPRTVARWQSDDAMPSVVRLGEIAAALGKTPGYFLDGAEEAA